MNTAVTPRKPGLAGRFLRGLVVWPFWLMWKGATAIERTLGIVPTLLVGTVLVAFGLFLCSTLLGVIVGLPVLGLGALLTARALY